MQHPLLSVCFVCALLFSPSLLLGLFADDFLWLSLYNGERFSHGDHTFKAFFFDAFSFFKGNSEELLNLKAQALVPWWADDALKIQFFRPVSAVTHWLDFAIFGNHFYWMHFHSIVWFCALLWAIQKWYWVFLSDFIANNSYFSIDIRKALFFALLIFSLDFSHLFPIYWLSNRNIIIASFFIFLSLWCFHCGLFSQLSELIKLKSFSVKRMRFYFLSLIFYFFAIFSSENAFFLVLFFPVYAFFSGRVSMVHTVGISTAYVAVLLVSIVVYSKLGYGVFATDLYIHPLQNIKLYFWSALEKVPLYWFSSLLGLDGFYMPLPYLGRAVVWVVSLVIVIGFFVCIRKWIFFNRSIFLLFIIINISLIPPIGFAVFDARTLFLASVPFSLFLSCLFFYYRQNLVLKSFILRGFFVGFFIFFHVIVSVFCWLGSGYFVTQFSHALTPISLQYHFLNRHPYDSAFILNHPDPLSHLYSSLAFPEHAHHLPYLLGTAFQKIKLTPLSDDSAPCQMKIEFSPQFFHAESLAHWLSFPHRFDRMHWRQHYFGARSASVFTMEKWKEGDKIEFPTFYIQIQKIRAVSSRYELIDEDKAMNENQGIHEIVFGARTNKTCREHLFYQWDTRLERYDQILPVENGKEYWVE